MAKDINLIKKIRAIIMKYNDEDRFEGISTLAPAKDILELFKNLEAAKGRECPECSNCGGTGMIRTLKDSENNVIDCPICHGTGQEQREEES